MVVSRNGGERVNITVEGQRVEQVSKFRYLGSLISEDGRCLDDAKTRIGMARDAFNKGKELQTRSIRVDLRKRLIKTLVWPVVLYGCETWTKRKEEINRLNAFEMWMWRRIGKVSWMDKRTNEQVLSSMNEKRSLIKNDKGQKEELDSTCCKGRWSDEIGDRRENGRKETKRKAKNRHDR